MSGDPPEAPAPPAPPAAPAPPAPSPAATLAPDEEAALHALILRAKPAFAGRVAGSAARLIEQPFFSRHRIGEWRSRAPQPERFFHFAIGPAAEVTDIQKRLDLLAAIAERDPPIGLDDPARARHYALSCDGWTSEYMLGQLAVDRFADIPFWPRMQAPTEARVDALRAQAAARMQPVAVAPASPGWLVEAWFVADQKLIRRRLLVRPNGRIARQDEIVASDLPVHKGYTWALRDGRMVPAS